MLVSLNWLREFVPYEGTAEELGHRLTMLGLELDSITKPFEALRGIKIGHVLTRETHPEADKLSVCTVDLGEAEPVTIVCGAPNVDAGQKVPVAPVGYTMPDGMKIKKAKLRGVPSFGMICSERELGLSEDHNGIMVLDPSLTVGQEFVDALGLDDTVLEIDLTPNRADCTSILGVARETAMAFGLPLSIPDCSVEEAEDGAPVNERMAIEIDDPELCPVYRGRLIEGVKIGPSPDWLRYRLIAVGQRPVNNVVDITNYILFELGQPLHAFDMERLEGGKIRVAPAEEGQKFTTLDEQERTLLASDLLINDGSKAVALAGVMGGANSETTDESTSIFLESAVFRPGTIRRTARRLALHSEASYRFERGVDQPGSLRALDRAAQLIAKVSGGRVIKGVSEAEPRPWVNRELTFRPGRARKLLGIDVTDEFCRTTLTALGCEITAQENSVWTMTAPSHRYDFEREADLIEEIARVHGMDRIPTKLPIVRKSLEDAERGESEYDFNRRVKRWGVAAGLHEAINYSFVAGKDLDTLGLPEDNRIPVQNPLSEEQGVLRTVVGAGLLNSLRQNLAQGNNRLRLFELAHIFLADRESETTAHEPTRLGILVHGGRASENWPCDQEDADYMDLKGIVEHLFDTLGLSQHGEAAYTLVKEHSWLNPCVEVSLGGEKLGVMGRVKPEIADAYHARKDVWMAELDADALRRLSGGVVQFRSLPIFPPSRRDITVVAPGGLQVAAIEEAVAGMKTPLLESMVLVDVYVPETNGDGEEKRNLTFRLTFRHASKTLKDKEVDKERDKIVKGLTGALPVSI